MNRKKRITQSAMALALSLALATPCTAELHSRLGGAAAYDDALDITWATDAGQSGSRSWSDLLAWVANLNGIGYLGFADWRLASMSVAAGLPTGTAGDVVDCSTIWQPLCQDNELGYMFFHNLGGSVGAPVTGHRVVGDVTLTNIQALYWSATESGATNAWMYHFDIGFGVWSPKNGSRFGWAVRDGDVLAADADGDGVADLADNCTLVANADQRDTNDDGYGNACDADLTGDGQVNFADLAAFKAAFLQTGDLDTDFDGDGSTNFGDLAYLKSVFLGVPGPSALVP